MPIIIAVSTDFAVSGVAKISPFQWIDNKAKVFPDQTLDVEFTVYNNTGQGNARIPYS